MLILYKPFFGELWFRKQLLEDPETMSYNRAWGGTVAFPRERWREWYEKWISPGETDRMYRYLLLPGSGRFVGEIARHLDAGSGRHLADVIIYAPCRGRGFGRDGLRLLCGEARESGLKELWDDIAADNPAVKLFLKEGFTEVCRTDECITLKKKL